MSSRARSGPAVLGDRQACRGPGSRVSGGRVSTLSERSNGLNQAALSELAGLLMATVSFEDLMQRIADLSGAHRRRRPRPAGSRWRRTGTWSPSRPPTRWPGCSTSSSTSWTKVPAWRRCTAVVVSAPDLSRETRWDGYPARALAHGVRAVYSSPLLVNDQPIGALNLYATTADPFDAAAQETAAQLTALAAATITAAMRHYNEATLTDHLRSALSSRSVIDQAIGIVMATERCSSDEAFNILRTVSQHRNIPIRQVAADLVAKTSDNPTS